MENIVKNTFTLKIAGINILIEENFLIQNRSGFFALFKGDNINQNDVRINIHKIFVREGGSNISRKTKKEEFIKSRNTISNKIIRLEDFTLEADSRKVIMRDFSNRELEYLSIQNVPDFEQKSIKSNNYFFQINYRDFISSFFPCFSAILLHSSGIIRKGKSLLFLAHSGGGKSTAINLSNDCLILSDDQIILRKIGSEIYAFGTPFGKKSSGQVSAKLGAFFILSKSNKFSLVPLESMDVLKYIWGTLPDQTYFLPHNLKIRIIDILNKATQKIPCYQLNFPKNFIDWEKIDRILNQK